MRASFPLECDLTGDLRGGWIILNAFQIYGRNYVNYSPENFQIKLMQLSSQLNLMYETDSVDNQVQIRTDNFLLALDSCAPFEVKLVKRPPAR